MRFWAQGLEGGFTEGDFNCFDELPPQVAAPDSDEVLFQFVELLRVSLEGLDLGFEFSLMKSGSMTGFIEFYFPLKGEELELTEESPPLDNAGSYLDPPGG